MIIEKLQAPLKGLKALGELLWRQRVVVQVPNHRESWVELCAIKHPADPRRPFVLRIGPHITTQPLSETDARQRLLEEVAFAAGRSWQASHESPGH